MHQVINMTRKQIDCRDDPNQNICTTAFSSDSKEELLAIARTHALEYHKYPDHPDTWAAVESLVKDA